MVARVLVVDDLLPNRRLLEAKLRNEFYDVLTAENGVEALHVTEQFLPDVILMDVMMPEMNGFEACKRLKTNPVTAHIPVIMVTALTDMDDRLQGLNVGADDFLTKPIHDVSLFARIRSLVRLKNMTDELRLRDQTGAQFGGVDNTAQNINTANARVLVIDDDSAQSNQLQEALKTAGVKTDLSAVPMDAVRLSEQVDYDVIIVSTQITGADGLHLCSHLRSQERTRHTPILMLIEENNTDLLVRGLDIGINDYLISPVDSNEAKARVRTQVRRKRYQDALRASHQQSLSMAITDGLTGVFNRRYFDIHAEAMLKQALTFRKPLAFMLIDIDHFKRINDGYGHLSGDAVLKQLPTQVTQSVRAADLVARYGGEEFAVLMPDTNLQQAAGVGERIRNAIEHVVFSLPVAPGSLQCTASIGVSASHGSDTVADLIGRADKALYHVKQTGRNRVAVCN